METKKCKELMTQVLDGENSEAVRRHLSECPACRELAELNRLTVGMPDRTAVPEELDRVVLAYAAAKKRTAHRPWQIAFILRHAMIPAAAAAMVCAGLMFAFHTDGKKHPGSLVQKPNRTHVSYDLDAVDSELLLLSSRIQDTAAQLSRTAVYTVINE